MKQSVQPPHPDSRPPVVVRDPSATGPAVLPPHRPERQEGAPTADSTATACPATEGRRPAQGPSTAEDRIRQLEAELAERTADLKRVKAEYDNYRKRVRRDRLAIREAAVANVLAGLLPVLDTIDRARALGDVTGGFHHVTRILEARLAALGLHAVGEAGEPFDPRMHEALTYTAASCAGSPRTTGATCAQVLRRGYRVGAHLVRAAEVAVAERPPLEPAPAAPPGLRRTTGDADADR
ncbi:nucleotide exchange factor GrpE [Streptomyces sp. JH14]|uniref:nucleotide exchange factor GrpE n=1 Tax=Streptomyces sp. JH14 TaxID=2793630 RepID=UPI0023F9E32B|nr:nucleotide exchange factor GrpE [Streptomyces sp. JH14]MDF6040705.1 nucleotide exchange factor GrpE [Streptomyces sp. JH14]